MTSPLSMISLFKQISEGIMKNENLKVNKVWAPGLTNAYEYVMAMQEKPKIVILHCGTNDLGEMNENEMVEHIMKIQEILENRGIIFIYSYITPRGDLTDINAKAEVVNAKLLQLVIRKPEVFFITE